MELIPASSMHNTIESYFNRITVESKVIYWIIIISVIAILAVLPYIYVDITVQARGFFQSEIDRQTINSPYSGRVIFSSIQIGRKVNKGDTLLIIDSESLRAQRTALETKMIENNTSIMDLVKLTSIDSTLSQSIGSSLKSRRYCAEYKDLMKQQLIQYQKYKKISLDHGRNKILFQQNLIPKADYEASLYAYTLERENLKYVLISYLTSWQSDLAQRKNDSARLCADLKLVNEELSNRIITSPVSGEILTSSDIQAGSMIAINQMVVEISPNGGLFATCFVKPSEIGMIWENQEVVVQVDAFKFNEWGTLKGRIVDISEDMIVENGTTAYFRIRCKMDRNILTLKNGYSAEVKKGMSINSRIIITRRSLANLMYDRIDNWFNPYTRTEIKNINAD